MKIQIINIVFFLIFFTNAFSQTISTTLDKKNILLEQFTGMYCGNCPQGHEKAKNLMNANENVYVVTIHAGYLAVPLPGAPDYRVTEGEMLDVMYNEIGYPSGLINRHYFSGKINLDRSEWIKNAKAIGSEHAPVNLLLTAVFDGNTRKLTVKVEGYYTMAVTEDAHRLNIIVTQNNIIGYQSGIGGGPDYVHNNMLRSFITPMNEEVWGHEIVNPAAGNDFMFEYEYDLPVDINGVPIHPEEIEVIAFVCANNTEVLNVTGGKPSYLNYEKPLSATLLEPARKIDARYGYHFFEAALKNLSHQTISSATFEVNINGDALEAVWSGEIPAFQTKPIIITLAPYSIYTTNSYSIKLIALNEDNYSGNTLSGSFNAPVETSSKIFIEIKTDNFADENRFFIKDRDGNTVHEFGPYPPNTVAVYKETATLDKNETYCFEVTDEWWDGMASPRGYFKMHNDDEYLIVQNYDVKLWGDRVFIHTSRIPQAISNDPDKQNINAYYNSSKNAVEISFSSLSSNGKVNFSLYAVTGQLLWKKTEWIESEKNRNIWIPADKLGNGLYLLKIETEKGLIIQKFVKQ